MNELALVLTARGVPFQRQPASEGLGAVGAGGDAPAAATELTLYRHENARADRHAADRGGRRRAAPAWSGTSRRCSRCSSPCTRVSSIATGSARAGSRPGALLGGEWWRAVTALTLHVELDHLGGNLAFGAFFGYFIGRYSGTGVGLARRAGRGVGRQRAERVGAVAGAPLDRRFDGGVRGARPSRGLHLAAAASCATRRGGRASRRSSRAWACSRSRARPARTPTRRAPVRLHRGQRAGRRVRAASCP